MDFPAVQPAKIFFTADRNKISYRSGALNILMSAKTLFNATVGALSYYSAFSTMKLNSKGKFYIHTINTPNNQWKTPAANCSWDPIKGVTVQSTSHEPCEIQHQSELCVADLNDGCFKDFFDFNENGRAGTTGGKFPDAINAIVDMIGTLEANAMAADLRTLFSSSSQFLGIPNVRLRDDIDELSRKRYEDSKNLCMGYPALCSKMAATNPAHAHLDQKELFSAADVAGGIYNGSVKSLLKKLRMSAKPELKLAISNGGGINAQGENQMPFAIVSLPIFDAVEKMWMDLCEQPLTADTCIKQETINVTVTHEGATYTSPIIIYKIDGLAVLCDSHINAQDVMTNAVTFFACITRPMNINIGASFGVRGNINNEQTVALTVQFPTETLGANNKILKQADALISVAIASPDSMVAARAIWVAA